MTKKLDNFIDAKDAYSPRLLGTVHTVNRMGAG